MLGCSQGSFCFFLDTERRRHGDTFCTYWYRSLSLCFSLYNCSANMFWDWKWAGTIKLFSSFSFASFRSSLKLINKPSLILPGRALTLLHYQHITIFKPLSASISHCLRISTGLSCPVGCEVLENKDCILLRVYP